MTRTRQEKPSIIKAIQSLESSTEVQFSAISQVRKAFLLGLWYKSFPDYMLEHLNTLYSWDLKEIDPEVADNSLVNSFKFQFISDTGDSWHQCYRDLRNLGWQRLKVHRDGGRLQYFFRLEENPKPLIEKPEGYRELHLLLDISISTCKQVQVGTETKEVPIMKTVCEDLVELGEDQEMKYSVEGINLPEGLIKEIRDGETIEVIPLPSAEVVPLVVIDDVEGVEMPEGQIPRKSEWEDKAAAAFQDAADSYLPADSPAASDDPNKDDEIPF
jgi:hypothetical protein